MNFKPICIFHCIGLKPNAYKSVIAMRLAVCISASGVATIHLVA